MNGFLVDINVISEFCGPRLTRRWRRGANELPGRCCFAAWCRWASCDKGVTILPARARRTQLEKSISAQVPLWFEGRILPVTLAIAERWGELDGIRQLAGRPLNAPEGMIAATALEHHLTMVTRNVKDFAGLGVALINSWLDHFRLIQPVDGAWPAKHAGQSYRFPDLHRFPPLDRHLQQIKFVPGQAFTSGADWIVPVVPADSFDDRTAPNALDELISKKKRCRSLKTPCDELYLLIAYDQALLHCSPITKVGAIAKEATATLAADRGPFTRVFLFLAIEPGYKVYRLLLTYPVISC